MAEIVESVFVEPVFSVLKKAGVEASKVRNLKKHKAFTVELLRRSYTNICLQVFRAIV